MRAFKFHRRTAVIGTVIALAVAGAAVAYFSTTGSGTVTVNAGTSSTVTINPTLSPATLYPGSTSTVTFTVSNSSSQSQHVNTIHLASVHACPAGDPWTGSACSNSGTEITSCESVETGGSDTSTANFWMPDVSENQNYTANTSNQATTNTGSLEMNNLSSSQDACKNASLYLSFTSS